MSKQSNASYVLFYINLVADSYDIMVFKLIEKFNLPEENGQSEAKERDVKARKLAYIKRLANVCRIAEEFRVKGYELTPDFLAWIKNELKHKYIEVNSDNQIHTLCNISRLKRHKYAESVFYNIIYCVLRRYGFRYQHKYRKELLKFDVFCNLTGNNHKTLSRKGTIIYTHQKIAEIWQDDKDNFPEYRKEDSSLLQDIINEIAEEIAKFFNIQ